MSGWQAVVQMATQSPHASQAAPEGLFRSSEVMGNRASIAFLRPIVDHAISAWRWLERKRTQQLATRRLRVAETISLGDKRFVSIIQVDGAQFLIGGAAGNVSLLATLEGKQGLDAKGWRQTSPAAEQRP